MAIRDLKVWSEHAVPDCAETASIHPLATVEPGATIGDGTRVWRFAHIREQAVIGARCTIGNCAFIDIGVRIGDLVKIQNNALVYAGVTIEDEVFIGPNVTFTNDRYPRAMNADWQIVPTHVCRGASIGANSTIICGTTIGAFAMVAAGSVVTKTVAPFVLVRGNPARPVGYVCLCGQSLGDTDLPIDQPVSCPCGCLLDLANCHILLPRKR